MTDIGLQKAVEAAKSKTNLAKGLGVTKGAISQWERVPGFRVIAVEKITGVHRSILRPDLYPKEPAQ